MIEDGVCFDVIYTDFSKAFDSVPHERLFLKMESLGIRGDILKWVKSFLKGRTQCVNVDGAYSTWRNVISGIPQGSVIGPILFVIFINDMPDAVKQCFCKLFADDCKLFGKVTDANENCVQEDLLNLEEWSRLWQLPFNAKKCKSMHFGHNNPRRTYTLNNQELESIRSEKDLGVMVDDSLKFHVHAAFAAKKANQMLGVIKKTYVTRDANTITTLYKSMVRHHLEYGNAIWGPCYIGDLKLVEGVQRRATKLIPHLYDKPYEERLKELKLPSMEYRRKRGDMIQCFKVINGLVRLDVNELFTPLSTSNTRGHHQRVRRHRAHKAIRAKSFSQRTIKCWNSLAKNVIDAPSVDAFKNRLDKAWEDKWYKTSAV
jgi:ribonuclease P/MRP protein subunit RPP40